MQGCAGLHRMATACPRGTGIALACMVVAVLFRVLAPLIMQEAYVSWIIIAQIFWILAFSLLTFSYSRMLFYPRVDGKAE